MNVSIRRACASVAFVSWLPVSSALGFGIPQPQSLDRSIQQADVIVDAEIRTLRPTPLPKEPAHPPGWMELGPEGLLSEAIAPDGTYALRVDRTIKGECPAHLVLHLPRASAVYYAYAPLTIQAGDRVLLLLQRVDGGGLDPVDPTVPLIPLADADPWMAAEPAAATTLDRVIDVMVRSMDSPARRRAIPHILCTVVAPALVGKLRPFEDDPDPETRDNVLECLAHNQDVAAIPRIAALEDFEEATPRRGSSAVSCLGDYTDRQAVPLLNPLLFNRSVWVRLNAAASLRRLADETSIPYLMLALRDPDPHKMVPYSSYDALRRLLGLPPHLKGLAQFCRDHTDDYVEFRIWWHDELAGRHPALATPLAAPEDAQEAAWLELVDSRADVRRAAMAKFSAARDRGAIPYLALALDDPVPDIAQKAAVLLGDMTGVRLPASATDLDSFEQRQGEITAPLYAWWAAELSGKHGEGESVGIR